MKKPDQVILRLLRAKSPQYGLDLVKASNGELRRGIIYVHLSRLEEQGFVRSEMGPEPSPFAGIPIRRLYFLAGGGRRALYELESESESSAPDGFPEGAGT